MKLDVITIDFWNTIFDSSNGSPRNTYRLDVFRKELIQLDTQLDDYQCQQAMEASWEYFNKAWKTEFRTPQSLETVDYLWSFLKLPYNQQSIENVSKAFSECVLYYPPVLMKGVKKSLEILSKKYKLGIISDTGFSPGTILQRLMLENEILQYFSSFSFSDETGVSKPHPKAFLKVLDELGCPPDNALHIGDIEETDIAGSKRLGMLAIKFSGDPSSKFSVKNESNSMADIELNNWDEIVDYLMDL